MLGTQSQYQDGGEKHGQVAAQVVGVAEGGEEVLGEGARPPGDEVPFGAADLNVVELYEPVDHDHRAAAESERTKRPTDIVRIEGLGRGHRHEAEAGG